MDSDRRLRSGFSDRACLQCQRRKTRCVTEGRNSACTYCIKKGKECDFVEPQAKTPLTRRNLDAAESRCRALEAQLRQLQSKEEPNTIPQEGGSSRQPKPLYEWHETFSIDGEASAQGNGRDGMSSLAAAINDSGYLGETSGSSLLENLAPLLQSQQPPEGQESAMMRAEQDPAQSFDFALPHHFAVSNVREHLINFYFQSYHKSYPIIHERTFRDQCSKKSQIPGHSPWHTLYYIVLAIGEWVSGQCHDENSLYYEAARSRLHIEALESGTVSILQAFLLLGNYLQKRDRPNTGYNFVGIAYRIALGLGLHRETSSGNEESFASHQRRILFWTLYCFESGFSITTGRPILVSDSFIDVRKPRNIDDSQCNASSNLPPEADYPTTCSAIIAQARLAIIANKIYNEFLSTRTCTDVNYHVAIAEQSITNWRSALPPFFTSPDVPKWFVGPRQMVLWKEANLRILLLLAGERQHSDEHDKVAMGTKCQSVAIETISDIAKFCQDYADMMHMGLSWYAVYFLLQASLALGIHQHKKRKRPATRRISDGTNSNPEDWEIAVAKAHRCLEALGPNNKAALRTMKILDRLFKNVRGCDTESDRNTSTSPAGPKNINSLGPRMITNQHRESVNDVLSPTGGMRDSNMGVFPSPEQLEKFPNLSTDNMVTTDFIENEWVASIDPSLHVFLDGVRNVDGVFEGVQGFPSTFEYDNFAYTTSSMQTVRTAIPRIQPPDPANISHEDPGWLCGQNWYSNQ